MSTEYEVRLILSTELTEEVVSRHLPTSLLRASDDVCTNMHEPHGGSRTRVVFTYLAVA